MRNLSPYKSYPKNRRRIDLLRNKFEAGGNSHDPADSYEQWLFKSWMRCKNSGIDPRLSEATILSEEEYTVARTESKLLIETSGSILKKVSSFLNGVPAIVVLADNKGTILSVIGDPSVRFRAADEAGVVEGSRWLESLAGTNGVGTAIAQRESVHVHSSEHFCEKFHKWSCAATPVMDPSTSEILGVIQFTSLDKDYRDDAMGLTFSITGQISAEIRLQLELERMHLIHGYSDYSSRYPSEGIIVCDRLGRVVRNSSCISADNCDLHLNNSDEKKQPIKVKQIYLPGSEVEIGSLLVVNRDHSNYTLHPIETVAPKPVSSYGEFVTSNDKLKQTMDRISKVILSDINVLLIGETGTGKELIANFIHNNSNRHGAPLIAVNCGAISKELFESKLFGYERGAFTGADAQGRKGLFENADGGTLFLDEVGELPLDMQVALLRVLDSGQFQRVGSGKIIQTNCRIIAATNRSLSDEVARGAYRADLYYRLAVAKFEISPIRDRPEDIPVLIQKIKSSLCLKHDMSPAYITPDAMELLKGYCWPGNGRELRNVIESAMICGGGTISVHDLPVNITCYKNVPQSMDMPCEIKPSTTPDISSCSNDCRIKTNVFQREYDLIVSTLTTYKDITLTCDALGVSRATFYRKCKSHGITPTDHV
jgi:transcriptional regulator of acetoin/glycerol metabolism